MEFDYSPEEIQEEPKLLNKKTKLGKKTILGGKKKLIPEQDDIIEKECNQPENEIENEEIIIAKFGAENKITSQIENSSTFLLKLILKAFYLSTWKRKIKSMKYLSRGYNPQRIKFKKLINSISSAIMQHKSDYYQQIYENMNSFTIPENIQHDKNFGTLRIVNKKILSEKRNNRIAEWAENYYNKIITGFKLYLLEALKKMKIKKETYGKINENIETDYSNYEKYNPNLPKNDKYSEFPEDSNKENHSININKERKIIKEEYFNDYSNDISKSQSDLQGKYNYNHNNQKLNEYYNQDINNNDMIYRPENEEQFGYIEEINYIDNNKDKFDDNNILPSNNFYDENGNIFNCIEDNKYITNNNYIDENNNYYKNINYEDNYNEIKENDYNNNDYIESDFNDKYNNNNFDNYYNDNEEKENDFNNNDFKENEYEEIYTNQNEIEENNNYPQIIYQDIDYPQEYYHDDNYNIKYDNKNYEIEEVYNNNTNTLYEDPKYSNYYDNQYFDNYNNYSHEDYDIDYIDENNNNINDNVIYNEEENYYEEPKEMNYYMPYNIQNERGFKYIKNEGNNILVSDVYTKPQIQNDRSQIKIYNFDNSYSKDNYINYEEVYQIKSQDNNILSGYKGSQRAFPKRYDNHSFYISK